MTARLGVTWWGHSSMSLRLGDVVVATDPLLSRRLLHLRRPSPPPPPAAETADVVLVSHLHRDHLHLPSLDRFDPSIPVVVPRGATRLVKGLAGRTLVEVAPGDRVEVAGVEVEVHPAHHDGRRSVVENGDAPAVGFRVDDGHRSVWYPGDTGQQDNSGVRPVDLAAVPIGGWGPTLGEEHLDPRQAAQAVADVGARWALAVHYGTFWPVAMRRLHPANHRYFFETPPDRFREAMAELAPDVAPLTPLHGVSVELVT
ncbi:membrane protein [Marmoricola endophyticus]|uniref:Membrane protein n=1 Tax=Marmoricola endophyticus TaxID=2040280 RepID=A0A917F1D0_9ACTN|nr:MBL fold metallo-hydrolase [Marmoricola endophyticus]GGF42707.1 membrane protein [Marmoricola endophyticus]